jgi:hypothetical protein
MLWFGGFVVEAGWRLETSILSGLQSNACHVFAMFTQLLTRLEKFALVCCGD